MRQTSIRLDNVVQRFRVIRERPDSLREAFTRVLRYKSQIYDFEALKGISFTIAEGETVGIVGRNGSGKSTTLKIIAGVYRPTSGVVKVSGQVAALIELGAGFHADLTGRENIVLNGLLLGMSRREIQAREESIVEFAELGDFIARSPVSVTGLMTMPPLAENPEDSRPHFVRLAELAAEHGLERLSMGTTQDFEVAVSEGATIVRLGTVLYEGAV